MTDLETIIDNSVLVTAYRHSRLNRLQSKLRTAAQNSYTATLLRRLHTAYRNSAVRQTASRTPTPVSADLRDSRIAGPFTRAASRLSTKLATAWEYSTVATYVDSATPTTNADDAES